MTKFLIDYEYFVFYYYTNIDRASDMPPKYKFFTFDFTFFIYLLICLFIYICMMYYCIVIACLFYLLSKVVFSLICLIDTRL